MKAIRSTDLGHLGTNGYFEVLVRDTEDKNAIIVPDSAINVSYTCEINLYQDNLAWVKLFSLLCLCSS